MSCRVLCRCSTARRRMRNCKRCMASIHWSSSIRSMCKFRRRRCKEGGYALNNAKNAFRGASLSLTSTIIRQKHTVTNPALSHLRHALTSICSLARPVNELNTRAPHRQGQETKRKEHIHVTSRIRRARSPAPHMHTLTQEAAAARRSYTMRPRATAQATSQPPLSRRPADAPSGRAQRTRPADAPSAAALSSR